MEFEELSLSPEVMEGVRKHGFSALTEVQAKVLPVSLDAKDVMVQSKTGSGKTLVFLVTIFEKYLKNKESRALVIAPTRELAVQIEEDAKSFSVGLEDYHIGCFFGGMGYEKQLSEIKEGLQLIVGTPGRLLDFSKMKKIDFSSFDTVVLDEADRMFDMGFYPDIQEMFKKMKPCTERQTMLFSATLSTKVRNLAWNHMNEPEEIDVQPEEITVKEITQELFHVTKEEKFPLLLSIMTKINPRSCIIFTNTKDKAVEVATRLKMNGYKSSYLMGDMAQSQRLRTLQSLKDGKITVLVATDVAARGLQIDDLELVVNYDIPEDFENYVHRIGRTARAGKTGKAITLACEQYIYGLEAIEEYIQMKIPVLWPDECGLEAVEDKSKDYKAGRSGRNVKRTGSQASSSRGPRKAGKGKTSSSSTEKKVFDGSQKSKPQAKKDKKPADSTSRKTRKASPEKKLKSEIAGKNVKRVSLKDIPAVEKKEEKGIIGFFKRLFKRG